VTSIEEEAFSGCSGLTSLVIPDKVTSIESGAFAGCIGLTSIRIPESVTSIADNAFSEVPLKTLEHLEAPSQFNYLFTDVLDENKFGPRVSV
jgi:hypothetical protein